MIMPVDKGDKAFEPAVLIAELPKKNAFAVGGMFRRYAIADAKV